jgi:formylglycine-generating enzyme required for sulfatase activity
MEGNVREWADEKPLWDTTANVRGYMGTSFGGFAALCPRDKQHGSANADYYSNTVGFRVASKDNVYSLSNFVLVEDINNSADTIMSPAVGAVSYTYYIGTYEITNNEYGAFLNSVAQSDPNGLYVVETGYDINDDPYDIYPMSLVTSGITRSGASGGYTYSVKNNYGNKPVNNITWNSAARYCNWLHNNKPTGSQNLSTTEDGAYTMSAATIMKNSGAKYALPTVDEWWKAAYYKSGGTNAGYWDHPTQSDTAPRNCGSDTLGNGLKP